MLLFFHILQSFRNYYTVLCVLDVGVHFFQSALHCTVHMPSPSCFNWISNYCWTTVNFAYLNKTNKKSSILLYTLKISEIKLVANWNCQNDINNASISVSVYVISDIFGPKLKTNVIEMQTNVYHRLREPVCKCYISTENSFTSG